MASSLADIIHYLARFAALQDRTRREPGIVPQATKEHILRFGLFNTGRIIHAATSISFKKDERIMVLHDLSGVDEHLYDNPMDVASGRNAKSYKIFGNGPQKCAGAPLARAEIQVFLERFVARMPEFRLDPDRRPVERCGSVPGYEQLYLRWD